MGYLDRYGNALNEIRFDPSDTKYAYRREYTISDYQNNTLPSVPTQELGNIWVKNIKFTMQKDKFDKYGSDYPNGRDDIIYPDNEYGQATNEAIEIDRYNITGARLIQSNQRIIAPRIIVGLNDDDEMTGYAFENNMLYFNRAQDAAPVLEGAMQLTLRNMDNKIYITPYNILFTSLDGVIDGVRAVQNSEAELTIDSMNTVIDRVSNIQMDTSITNGQFARIGLRSASNVNIDFVSNSSNIIARNDDYDRIEICQIGQLIFKPIEETGINDAEITEYINQNPTYTNNIFYSSSIFNIGGTDFGSSRVNIGRYTCNQRRTVLSDESSIFASGRIDDYERNYQLQSFMIPKITCGAPIEELDCVNLGFLMYVLEKLGVADVTQFAQEIIEPLLAVLDPVQIGN